MPLYDHIDKYDATEKASEFNVMAKHSLEKTAATHADVFTTVSDITARECSRFLEREVDVVTPNGFENSITPPKEIFKEKQQEGREALLHLHRVC